MLLRPHLARLHRLRQDGVERLVAGLVANAAWYEPDAGTPAPDPGDDHLWALIDALGACLITGDTLLVANPPANASVISPRRFVDTVLVDQT